MGNKGNKKGKARKLLPFNPLADRYPERLGMLSGCLMNAAASGKRPIITVLRGGGLGDNLQAAFVCEALRRKYSVDGAEPNIILIIRHDAGMGDMIERGAKDAGNSQPVQNYVNLETTIDHMRYTRMLATVSDIHVEMVYTPKIFFKQGTGNAILDEHAANFNERWNATKWNEVQRRDYPLSNLQWAHRMVNLLKWQFEVMGLDYLDKLPLWTPPSDSYVQFLDLVPGEYVTFAPGAGGNSFIKEYPWKRSPVGVYESGSWLEVLMYLKARGLKVLHLGKPSEPEVPKAFGYDLRGRTTLQEATGLIKDAAFHIGIEGGLVHYARCVDTPSIVVIGPTGKTQFGYDDNINVSHERCMSCFWRTPLWYQEKCPRKHKTCFNFPDSDEIKVAIDQMLDRVKRRRTVLVAETEGASVPMSPNDNWKGFSHGNA